MFKSSRSPGPYDRSGFTLIEMLFSLALLLLITSFATSAVAKWLESRMLLNTAETLVCELEALRVSAIEDSVDVAFQIMGGKNEFTVEVIGSSASKRSGHIRDMAWCLGPAKTAGTRVRLSIFERTVLPTKPKYCLAIKRDGRSRYEYID